MMKTDGSWYITLELLLSKSNLLNKKACTMQAFLLLS